MGLASYDYNQVASTVLAIEKCVRISTTISRAALAPSLSLGRCCKRHSKF